MQKKSRIFSRMAEIQAWTMGQTFYAGRALTRSRDRTDTKTVLQGSLQFQSQRIEVEGTNANELEEIEKGEDKAPSVQAWPKRQAAWLKESKKLWADLGEWIRFE
jgi:hypothetical protein